MEQLPHTYSILFYCREAVAGGRIFLNSTGRDVVSLSLNGARENDAGYWNCSAQVYDGDVVVGGPVEWDIQLVVVGESSLHY